MRGKDEWMFPISVTSGLQGARGEGWRELTDYIGTLEEEHEDSLAFALMMIRLCGCVSCQPGCYKLSLGCETCAYRAVANEKCSDTQLIRRYHVAREEVQEFLEQRHQRTRVREPEF